MRLIRFMGFKELADYLDGNTLRNTTDWNKAGQRSGSKGFCFFDDTEPPEERLKYVSGVVNTEIVAIFRPVPFAKLELTESYGIYRDNKRDLQKLTDLTLADLLTWDFKEKRVREYSTTKYNAQILQLEKLGVPERYQEGWRIEWKNLRHVHSAEVKHT